MKKLHSYWGHDVQFLDVLIRQAHPGPRVGPYRTLRHKLADARAFRRIERTPYPMLVDDLEGTVHQVYSGLADPTFLIDVDGRVAYYNMWTHAPSLYRAIEQLLRQGGRGVVAGGIDHVPHLGTSLVHGWKGIRRGLPQSYLELELAAPGMGTAIWLGYQLRPLLKPLVMRAKPLPKSATALLWAGALGLLAVVAMRNRRS